MKIRNRLTFLFIVIVAVIQVMASALIYLFSADYRKEAFYDRLTSKANNTAKLLIDVDEIDIALLTRIEKDNPSSLPGEKIIIYDFENTRLFSTDEQQIIRIDAALLDRIRSEEEIRYWQDDYEVLGFLFEGKHDTFVVVSAATDIYGFNKLRNLRTILLFVFVISLVLVTLSGWIYSGNALKPISKVVHQVDDISITSLNLRVDEGSGRDEIAHLARTFNNMLTRLEEAFNLQRDFIANASHELRTPLTAIRGQLEVSLLETNRTSAEYEAVIASVLDDIRNLSYLSNRLLLLAQTSSEGARFIKSRLRVDEVLWQAREEVLKLHPAFSIVIDIDQKLDDESNLTLTGDDQLLKVAFTNIMENGCKYASDSHVRVLITSDNQRIIITCEDKGIGIPTEDLPSVLEPFYRAKNSQQVKGHGIGLSMVNRIMNLHQGELSIESSEGKGTTVRLSLPLSDAI